MNEQSLKFINYLYIYIYNIGNDWREFNFHWALLVKIKVSFNNRNEFLKFPKD